jgi:hypothetical protein
MTAKSTGAAEKSKAAGKPTAAVKPKTAEKVKKPAAPEVTFLCRRCEKRKPLADMKLVTRFVPVLVVCEDCAGELR